MNLNYKLVVLWGLTIIGMILHFNYHIGGIFYGVDIVKPGYNGKEPAGLIIIRTLFYHLPVLWILFILYIQKRWMNLTLFVLSILYCIAHTIHFIEELLAEEKNGSQISLLFIVLIVAGFLVVEHYKTIRKINPTNL